MSSLYSYCVAYQILGNHLFRMCLVMITFPSMIAYGKIVWRKKLGSWINPEKLVKRIKLL